MKNKNVFLLSLVLLLPLVFNTFGTNIFELPKITFLAFFLSITVIVFVLNFLFKGEVKFIYNKSVHFLVGLLFLSLVLSTVFSIAPQLSFWGSYDRFQGLYSYVIYILFFLIFLNFLRNKKSQIIFLKVLVTISFIIGIHAILQKFQIGLFLQDESAEFLGRSFSTLGHPNFLGQFLLFPIWATIYFVLNNKNKFLPIFVFIVLFTVLLITENRASILGFILSFIFFVFFYAKIAKKYKYYLFTSLTFGFLFFVFMFLPSLRSLSSRILIWKGSIEILPDYFLLGSGLETFSLVFQKVVRPEMFELEHLYSIPDRAHNIILDIMLTQGAFGLIVYLLIIGSLIYLIVKQIKNQSENMILMISTSALISIIVSGLFGFYLSVHYILIALFLAIVLNNSAKFKVVKLKQNLVGIFLSGVIIVLSVATIVNSIKIIYADILLSSGVHNVYYYSEVEKGISQMQRAINLNPHQSEIYFYLADILSSFESKDADIIAEMGGEFTNQNFVYYLLRGKINYSFGNYVDSEVLFEKASILAPSNPLIKVEWGNMYFAKKDYLKAIDKYEDFLSVLPNYWQFGANLSELDFEASEKYRLLVKHIPNFESVILNLSKSYGAIGNLEKSQYFLDFVR